MRGTVKWFNDEKGYGFAACDDGQDAFVHCSELVGVSCQKLPVEGDVVEFERSTGVKGLRATGVRIVSDTAE